MFVYNHKQSEWRELAAMKTARAMFGAIIHGGKIIVVGGVNEEGLCSACETYDFAANKYVDVNVAKKSPESVFFFQAKFSAQLSDKLCGG